MDYSWRRPYAEMATKHTNKKGYEKQFKAEFT